MARREQPVLTVEPELASRGLHQQKVAPGMTSCQHSRLVNFMRFQQAKPLAVEETGRSAMIVLPLVGRRSEGQSICWVVGGVGAGRGGVVE